MIEGGLTYFLGELGAVLDDPTISLSADGTIGRTRTINAINAAQTKIMRALLDMGVRDQVFARKVTLAEDASDDDVSILPYRLFALLSVEDSNGQAYPAVYSRLRREEAGFIVERRAATAGSNYCPNIRWWNFDRPSTVYAWVLEEPAKLSYGDGTYTSTTVTLEASPDYGPTMGHDDYYNGVELVEAGANQIREISDYVGSTRVATVATWTSTPSAQKYEILTSLPRVAWDALVYEATMRIVAIDARWWDEKGIKLANLRRQREASLLEAFRILSSPVRGAATGVRQATEWSF